MLRLRASSRPVQNVGAQTLTYTVPEISTKGEILALLIVHPAAVAADSLVALGWELAANGVGATTAYGLWVKIVDDDEPATVVVTSCDNTAEWHGQMLLLAEGSPGGIVESLGGGDYAADATPITPGVESVQAINLLLYMWSSNSACDLEPPAGLTKIDDYQTALVAARTSLFAYRLALVTNANPGFDTATSDPASTGIALAFVLRAGPPPTPPELYDPIPGHIGLLGKDSRRGR